MKRHLIITLAILFTLLPFGTLAAQVQPAAAGGASGSPHFRFIARSLAHDHIVPNSGSGPDLGVQPWWTFDSGVNVENGNLVLATSDVSMTGVGLPLEIGRVYNSLSTGTSDFGSHWLMDTGADVGLQIGTNITFTGPTGYGEVFTPNGGGGWTAPPGADADLVKNQDNSYTLTDHASGEKLNFSSGGVLTSDVDLFGNTVSYGYDLLRRLTTITDTMGGVTHYAYNSPYGTDLISQITDPAGRQYQYTYNANKQLVTSVNASGTGTGTTT